MGVVVIVLVLGVIGFAVNLVLNEKKPKAQRAAEKTKNARKMYKFLTTNFLTQGAAHKIYAKLSALTIFRQDQLYTLVSKYLFMSWGTTIAMSFVCILLFKDTVSRILCVVFAVILGKKIIEKQLDNLHLKVMKAMSMALGAVRQEYMKTDSVVEAIGDAEIPDILKKPFDAIYTILTASDSELRLREFYESTPFRVLQTFVGVCYNVNNQGDTKDSYGASNFIQALTVLSTDVNAEITKITTQKQKFGIIEYLPFVPLFAISFLEGYFTGIMPGTALIYGGTIGYICRTITILASIMGYSVVSSINSTVPIKEDDKSEWVLKLLANKKWRAFIDNLKPKDKKALKVQNTLKQSLSRQSIEEVYMKKIVYGAIALVGAVIALISTLSLGGEFTRNSTQQLSLVATDEMSRYSKESILTLDRKYFEKRDALQPDLTLKEEFAALGLSIKQKLGLAPKPKTSITGNSKSKYPDISDDEKAALVMAYMPGLSDLQVIDQGKRMADKYESMKNIEFKWFFVWICFFIGIIGYNVPNLSLSMRKLLVRTESEDDFLQLQTLVSILMTTDMDTLDTLHELSQNSRVHKDMLTYCYHSFPSNPEMELTRLQSKTPLNEFKRFIGKLKLTINDLSLSEAFSDLAIEREQIMRIREITIQATIARKRAMCGPLSLAPLACMVVGELLIPLGYLGFREFMNALSMM